MYTVEIKPDPNERYENICAQSLNDDHVILARVIEYKNGKIVTTFYKKEGTNYIGEPSETNDFRQPENMSFELALDYLSSYFIGKNYKLINIYK